MAKSGDVASKLARKFKAEQITASVPEDERLEDFIVRVSPKLTRPMHLGRALELLNQVRHIAIRLLWSVPPRHGKSFSTMHLIAQTLKRDPTKRIAYITHTESLALEHSRLIRDLTERAGVELSKEVRAAEFWKTAQGGSLMATGVGGPIMGRGFDLVVFDDPYKSRSQVESLLERQRVQDFYDSAVKSRVEPGGSIVILHTRYHPDDLIGVLDARDRETIEDLKTGWEYVNVPAISDAGVALWPERYPIKELLKIKAENEYEWASMYMGRPRPRGGAVFNDTTLYDPEELKALLIKREAIGLDLAYTNKTYSDYSVCVSALLVGNRVYITNVRRKQCDVNTFSQELRSEKILHPRATIFWWIGGIEKPVLQLLANLGIYVRSELARTDKFVRAQAVATAWNEKRVLIPNNDPAWVTPFLNEILAFTGVGDKHDDQVDALAAAFHPLLGKPVSRGVGQQRIVPF